MIIFSGGRKIKSEHMGPKITCKSNISVKGWTHIHTSHVVDLEVKTSLIPHGCPEREPNKSHDRLLIAPSETSLSWVY